MDQPLLTPASVALSLSPPRTPPYDSPVRKLYNDPTAARRHLAGILQARDDLNGGDASTSDGGGGYQSHAIASRILHLTSDLKGLPLHPHIPSSLSLPVQLTRFLGATLPLEWQHSSRDGGSFRSIADNMVKLSCPMLGLSHVRQALEFASLTYGQEIGRCKPEQQCAERECRSKSVGHEEQYRHTNTNEGQRKSWSRKRIHYGAHPMQNVDLFLPSNSQSKLPVRGTLFFVHGGAWGSGHPWMYRLVASPFLKQNFAVVIAGYRTYPDAPTIDHQVADVRMAWDASHEAWDDLITECDDFFIGNIIMGHSSGAHVSLLMLIDWIGERIARGHNPLNAASPEDEPWRPDHYVGLSGVYDIGKHFDFEAGRGVEEISPLKPICGYTRQSFDDANPVKRLMALMRGIPDDVEQNLKRIPTIRDLMPKTLLVHGIDDSTVPFTSTTDCARSIRSLGIKVCDELYLTGTGHQDVIMHFMLGGPARNLVFDWLDDNRKGESSGSVLLSRL